MARTLVHYAEILAHVFLFFAVHIVGRLYFAICNVSKSLRLHCFFFKSVSGQASDKLILSDSIWLERTFFKVGMITHGFSWTIWLVLISDRLWSTMERSAPLNCSPTEHWRSRSRRLNWVKFSRVSCVSCIVEWIVIRSQLLVESVWAIRENLVFNFADSFMDVTRSVQRLDLGRVVRVLLDPGLHVGTCKIAAQSILLPLLRLPKKVINQVHWQIFFHSFICIEQCLCLRTCVLCFDCLVALLMLREIRFVDRWIYPLWCGPNSDRVILILLPFSILHGKVFHALLLMSLFQILAPLGALLVDYYPLWILDVLFQYSLSRLQGIIFCQKADHGFTLQTPETSGSCTTLSCRGSERWPWSCLFLTVWRLFLHQVLCMSECEVGPAGVVESDRWYAVSVLLGRLRCSFGLGISRSSSWEEEGVTVINRPWLVVVGPLGSSSFSMHVLKSKLGD